MRKKKKVKMWKLETTRKELQNLQKKLNGINHPTKSQMYGHDQNELFIKYTQCLNETFEIYISQHKLIGEHEQCEWGGLVSHLFRRKFQKVWHSQSVIPYINFCTIRLIILSVFSDRKNCVSFENRSDSTKFNHLRAENKTT